MFTQLEPITHMPVQWKMKCSPRKMLQEGER